MNDWKDIRTLSIFNSTLNPYQTEKVEALKHMTTHNMVVYAKLDRMSGSMVLKMISPFGIEVTRTFLLSGSNFYPLKIMFEWISSAACNIEYQIIPPLEEEDSL